MAIADNWGIHESAVARLLAAYVYDERGDLISAQDEDGASWQYGYSRHFVTCYTDRTGRG